MEKIPQRLIKLERFVFRPLFVFATFSLILFAAVQGSGRLMLGVAPFFTEELNRVVLGRGVVLTGIKGDWLGFNPVVSLDAATFPAGVVEHVKVELDVLESIFRSTFVARRIVVGQAQLHIEQVDGAWQLRGMGDGETFDVGSLLMHSDEISGTLTLVIHGEDGHEETLVARGTATNRGGRHVLNASVLNPAVEETGLHLALQAVASVPGVKAPEVHCKLQGRLTIPSLLTGMADLRIEVSAGEWFAQNETGSGRLDLTLANVTLPGAASATAVAATTSLMVSQYAEKWVGRTSALVLQSGDDRFEVPPVHLSYTRAQDTPLELPDVFLAEGSSDPPFRLWLEELDLTSLGRFAVAAVGNREPVGRWLKALEPGGRATNLHAYYDPEDGAGYQVSLSALSLDGYKGVPTVRNLQGSLWGHAHGSAIQLNADGVDVQFPGLFDQTWRMSHLQGFVKAWYGPGYFALQGTHLKARLPETSVAGAFALTRPDLREDQRLTLVLRADELTLDDGRRFIPFKIPEALKGWLRRGPRSGDLSDIRFAYHGQVETEPNELGRRLELRADVADASVEYDPAWPVVTGLFGTFHTAGVDTKVRIDRARTLGAVLEDTSVVLRQNGRYADVHLLARLQDDEGLNFVRNTPLRKNLAFVTDAWTAHGSLRVGGDLVVPIQEDAPALTVTLDVDAEGFGLDMPEFHISVADLAGEGTFSLPHMFSGAFEGRLFDRAARFTARADEDWLRFDIAGTLDEADVYALLDYADIGVMRGDFGYEATLSLAMAEEQVTHLDVTTDLAGLNVDLPAHLGKAPADVAPAEISVQFLPDYQSIHWQYRDTTGWVHTDKAILRGAIGVGTGPPMIDQQDSAIAIHGHMDQVWLSDWVSKQGEAAVALPTDWRIIDLAIDTLHVDELAFDDVTLRGAQEGRVVSFGFASPGLTGEVVLPGSGPIDMEFAHVRLPASGPQIALVKGIELKSAEDPIPVAVGRALPSARVHIARLDLGEEPFGEWRFVIEPGDDTVSFTGFNADVNGVHIADSRAVWDLEKNSTSFVGSITLDDLAQTLPKWDYAPSVQTRIAQVDVDATWHGSPANVSLLGMSGDLRFTAQDGRFLEVATAQGGLRMMSLLNLSTILGRIGGDFSDVTGAGIAFKSIAADVYIDQGVLEFRDRLFMDSTASNFEFGGRVNLNDGTLDNEMIVTLPVSESLPWYSAYLALANPLLGLGVLVGERVLRKPIQQLSSAKFKVSGTLDDPQVEWVSIWDKSMKEHPPAAKAPESTEAAKGLVESGGN